MEVREKVRLQQLVRVRLGLLAVDLDARPRAGLGFCQAFPHVPVESRCRRRLLDRGAEGG